MTPTLVSQPPDDRLEEYVLALHDDVRASEDHDEVVFVEVRPVCRLEDGVKVQDHVVEAGVL